METEIAARGCFLVDAEINADNDIVLTIESEQGFVEMDDCVALSGIFQEKFDRDAEDYSLTVTSAGLDQPFKVLKQFQKAIGSKVDVRIKGGRKLSAILKDADEESITISYMAKEAVEGKKKKVEVEHCDKVMLSEVNSVIPHIEFE